MITRSPSLSVVVTESCVSAVTLVMDLRIDSGNAPRIASASFTERFLRLASISLTSITGMPSTLAFFTEFNTRAWESTAVRVSPLFSMAAGRCALTSTLIDLGNCLETLASLTPGMDLSCSVTSWAETRNNDFPACLSAMTWMVCALTHSLAPDTPISLVSRRNTDEKSSSHVSPVTTATLTTAINTRNATTRTFARLRSLARSVKFTTFGRDTTPREPVVWCSVSAT